MPTVVLNNQIQLFWHTDTAYNSNLYSIHIGLPRTDQNAATASVLAALCRRGCDEYPDFAALNRRLYALYGAAFLCNVTAASDRLYLNMALQCIDDRFAFEGESIGRGAVDFLLKELFCRSFDSDHLPQEDIELEKQNLIQDIRGIVDNKREYLLQQATGAVYGDTPLAVHRFGSEEQAAAVTRDSLQQLYQSALNKGEIFVTMVGCSDFAAEKEMFAARLNQLPCRQVTPLAPLALPRDYRGDRHIALPVSQSKLALCYLPPAPLKDEQMDTARVALAMLGKMPTSRLFMQVREKLSLCYYCDVSISRATGLMCIDLGLNQQDTKRAIQAIQQQIDALAAGDWQPEEFELAKKYLINAQRAARESLASVESWYFNQLLYQQQRTPQQDVQAIQGVTPHQVAQLLAGYQRVHTCQIIKEEQP